MSQASEFKVGDKLVRFSSVYTITDIKEEQRGEDDEPEKVLYFEPLFKNNRNETLVCSIPVDNVSKTNIRRPLSKEKIDELMEELANNTVEKMSYKRNTVRKRVNENEAGELVRIIKNLWIEKTDEDRNFTVTKRNLFRKALKKFAQEVAYVRDMELEEARQLILDTLEETGEYTHA